MIQRTLTLTMALLLTACASGPRYDEVRYTQAVTPQQATAEAEAMQGREVLWGGTVVEARNLSERSQIELVAYPLNDDQRPSVGSPPQGRFLAVQPGYLETAEFTPGRHVTLVGQLDGTIEGKLGEASYTYPLLKIEQYYLWKEQGQSEPRLHFGIGVLFSR